jgi:pimeloyl-ACP methyl ester carboxylesterase
VIVLGSGPPVVVVPGIQGRWEWMRPAVDALAARCCVMTFSLCGDPGSGADFDPVLGFDSFVAQIDRALDRNGLTRAVICGVSFGGLVALRYAATRPGRASAVVLVCTPAPDFQPAPRFARYITRPWLYAPAFALTSPARLWPEIDAALPTRTARLRFGLSHWWRIGTAPASPGRMAARMQLRDPVVLSRDASRIRVPVLVVTGEPHLDRVVGSSPLEYSRLIPGSRLEVLKQTGHIGLVTRPTAFARLVADFVEANGPHD